MGAGLANGGADLLDLVGAEIVEDDDVAGFEFRHQHLLDIDAAACRIDRAIEDEGGANAVGPKCGDKGHGVPMAEGAWPNSRSPRGAQPLSGAMFVFVQVSSMKTRRDGSIRGRCFSHRARATSGRSRSLATSVFFITQPLLCTKVQTADNRPSRRARPARRQARACEVVFAASRKQPISMRTGKRPRLVPTHLAGRSDNVSDNDVLHRRHVRQRLLEACRPKHSSLPCVDELRDDPYPVAGLTFYQIANSETVANILGACRLSLVGGYSVPRHHGQRGKPTQCVDDILRQSTKYPRAEPSLWFRNGRMAIVGFMPTSALFVN